MASKKKKNTKSPKQATKKLNKSPKKTDKKLKLKKKKKQKKFKKFQSSFRTDALPSHYRLLLLTIRLLSAAINPISDCDETYNYWEPTSYLITDYGFQTWEYSPVYALRSYLYLLPQVYIGKFFLIIFPSPSHQVYIFFIIRGLLSLFCASCEIYFIKSIFRKFGHLTGVITFLFLIFSSGMFNVSSSYLPQQFVLCFGMLSFGSFLNNYRIQSILFMGIAVIIGWPFVAILAIPIAIDCCTVLGLMQFILYVLLFGSILCISSIICDYIYYNKILLAPLNIFLYNLNISSSDSTSGQNLYGTESWTFYVKNLIFNWNIVYLLALIAPITCLYSFKNGINRNIAHCIVPFWIWYLFFTYMPHKEERFLFVIYPFIALNASLTLTQFRLFRIQNVYNYIFKYIDYRNILSSIIFPNFRIIIMNIFFILSLMRVYGQVRYYSAPLTLWKQTCNLIIDSSDNIDASPPYHICVGKEWYRIPTSLLISSCADIKWINSSFDGQLPTKFEATNIVNSQPFNDKNREEITRYVVDVYNECDYIIDLWESDTIIHNYDVNKYKIIIQKQFLDRKATPSGFKRSFYIPYFSNKQAVYARYVLLKRIKDKK